MKKRREEDEYYTDFKGVRLNKVEANRVGVGIIFGIIGVIFNFLLPFEKNNILNYIILLLFVFFGYFMVGPKIFKKKSNRDVHN